MTYDGRLTHSDPLGFSPTVSAVFLPELEIIKILIDEGEILKCIRVYS